jgi:hypothetical protein
MKSILLAAALTGVSFTGSAFAYSPKDTTATPTPRPVASSIVRPERLPVRFAGAVINVEFTLDQAGQPHEIKVLASDPVVKKQMAEAFRQWRFEPGVNGPDATQKRYILPVHLLPEV